MGRWRKGPFWTIWSATCLAAISACDPGFSYMVPGWRELRADGVRYEGEVHRDVRARLYSSAFGGSLGIELEVQNMSAESLSYDGSTMYLADVQGKRLPDETVSRATCRYSAAVPASIGPGERLTISCRFSATLSGIPGLTLNSALKQVILIQEGFRLPSAPVPIAVRMSRAP
jgi:hypothetical protein